MTLKYNLTTDLEAMDINAIHEFLSQSYWCKDIPLSTLRKGLNNSLCFGVVVGNKQVAFARMITDRATYAYLADVYVLENYRGKGISKLLLKYILEYPEIQGLRRIVLATRDAHGLYKKFGFSELANPDIFMELWVPNVYQSKG